MRIQTGGMWTVGALLGLLALSGCNAGGEDEGLLEGSAPEVSTLSQAPEKTEEVLACTCGTTRTTFTASSYGFRCTQAEQNARESLARRALATCPSGYCNVVETLGPCERQPDNRYRGAVHWTFSCCQ